MSLRSSSFILYAVALLLPATFSGSGVTAWGWQMVLISLAPLFMLLNAPDVDALIPALLVTPSNVGFWLTPIFMSARAPRAALASSIAAVISMLSCGFMVPDQAGTGPISTPGGHLGPGYYLWLAAGVVMLRAAWQSPPEPLDAEVDSAEPAQAGFVGVIEEKAARINAQIAEADRARD